MAEPQEPQSDEEAIAWQDGYDTLAGQIMPLLTRTRGGIALTAALHEAVAALNTNSFSKRSLALQDLAREVTRLLGLEWNPYGQTRAPDGTITRKDEDIRP